jgi:hypothetical protein
LYFDKSADSNHGSLSAQTELWDEIYYKNTQHACAKTYFQVIQFCSTTAIVYQRRPVRHLDYGDYHATPTKTLGNAIRPKKRQKPFTPAEVQSQLKIPFGYPSGPLWDSRISTRPSPIRKHSTTNDSQLGNLAFLAANGSFPGLDLKDSSEVDLVITSREYISYACLLVHNGRVLVEGPIIEMEYFEMEDIYIALFNAVSAEVERVIAKKKKSSQRWIGDGKKDVWEVD